MLAATGPEGLRDELAAEDGAATGPEGRESRDGSWCRNQFRVSSPGETGFQTEQSSNICSSLLGDEGHENSILDVRPPLCAVRCVGGLEYL